MDIFMSSFLPIQPEVRNVKRGWMDRRHNCVRQVILLESVQYVSSYRGHTSSGWAVTMQPIHEYRSLSDDVDMYQSSQDVHSISIKRDCSRSSREIPSLAPRGRSLLSDTLRHPCHTNKLPRDLGFLINGEKRLQYFTYGVLRR